jgi:hypothetical protein
MSTITSANSVFALAVANVFPTPQLLQGYSADDTFSTEAVEMVETVQGIDGNLSGGYVFVPYKMTISIMPDSPSLDIFYQWAQYQLSQREVAVASASIALPSISKKFTLQKGFLTSNVAIPEAKKVLQASRFQITWQQILGQPV